MKIKSVRTYQAVMFEKIPQTYFSMIEIANKPKIELKLTEDTGAHFIEVKSEKDLVYIPLSNISGIYTFNQSDEENLNFAKAEAKKTLTPTEPKRPR